MNVSSIIQMLHFFSYMYPPLSLVQCTAKHYNLKNKAIFNPWEFLTIKACLCPPIALQKAYFMLQL